MEMKRERWCECCRAEEQEMVRAREEKKRARQLREKWSFDGLGVLFD